MQSKAISIWIEPELADDPTACILAGFGQVVTNFGSADVVVARLGAPIPPTCHIVIRMATTSSETEVRQAIATNAAALVHAGMNRNAIAAVWQAALAGLFPIPRGVAHQLSRRLAEPPLDLEVSNVEAVILTGLVAGRTITDISADIGYSGRHTRRLARALQQRLAVSGRNQTIAAAIRWGIVTAESTASERAPLNSGTPRDNPAFPDT